MKGLYNILGLIGLFCLGVSHSLEIRSRGIQNNEDENHDLHEMVTREKRQPMIAPASDFTNDLFSNSFGESTVMKCKEILLSLQQKIKELQAFADNAMVSLQGPDSDEINTNTLSDKSSAPKVPAFNPFPSEDSKNTNAKPANDLMTQGRPKRLIFLITAAMKKPSTNEDKPNGNEDKLISQSGLTDQNKAARVKMAQLKDEIATRRSSFALGASKLLTFLSIMRNRKSIGASAITSSTTTGRPTEAREAKESKKQANIKLNPFTAHLIRYRLPSMVKVVPARQSMPSASIPSGFSPKSSPPNFMEQSFDHSFSSGPSFHAISTLNGAKKLQFVNRFATQRFEEHSNGFENSNPDAQDSEEQGLNNEHHFNSGYPYAQDDQESDESDETYPQSPSMTHPYDNDWKQMF